MKFTTIMSLLGAAAAATGVHGATVARDTWNPKILTPNKDTVWTYGGSASVTWDTSNPPAQISNEFTYQILLRINGVQSPIILAQGLDALAGATKVAVPHVLNGTHYSLTLFGSSDNWSEDFTILSPN